METTISPSGGKESNPGNPNPSSPSPSTRLWRPAAQRNLRNQWSKLLSSRDRWISTASDGRSNATSLVNAYLNWRYMPEMDLGVLKDMPGIRKKAREKLAKKQMDHYNAGLGSFGDVTARNAILTTLPGGYISMDFICFNMFWRYIHHNLCVVGQINVLNKELCRGKLLSSYKDMVIVVSHLVKASSSMRCFLKGSTDSPLIQFSYHTEDKNDSGDCGGISVFSSWSISHFEKLAQEVVEMFVLELSLKRLLVIELLSISCEEAVGGQTDRLSWSHELYLGEYDDLRMSGLLSKESCQPLPPRIKDWQSDSLLDGQPNHPPNREVLQVYLTTWLADVNIDMNRVEEIFAMVEEEMQVKLS